jgi:outer membrane biosynthesis protein TonB
MAGLFTMADGSAGGTAKRFGASQETADLIDNVQKPPPPPPEPPPPIELNDAIPVESVPPEPAPEAPAAPAPAAPKPEPIVTPAPDPYAAKRGEVQRLAQARARRSRQAATIIGSDTLG